MLNLTIRKGSTLNWVLRPEQSTQKYVPIQRIDRSAPMRIHVDNHGMLDGWRFLVTGVRGMTQVNAKNTPPKAGDYYRAVVLDANTIEVNRVNSRDYGEYVRGGVVQYSLPMDLTGYTARAQIRPSVDSSDVILDLTSYVTIDVPTCRVKFSVPATVTEAVTARSGVYDVELVDAAGVVVALPLGGVSFIDEVTR